MFRTSFLRAFAVKSFTDAHVREFHENGIVCVPNFIPAETADSLRHALTHLVEKEAVAQAANEANRKLSVFNAGGGDQCDDSYFMESGDKIRFFLERNQTKVSLASLNKVAHALHCDGGPFQSFCSHPAFGGIARKLGRAQPSVIQSMYILKPPRVGTAVGPHQDSTWIHTRPLSCLGIWFALDDCKIENSCLEALLGSHRTHMPLSARSRLVVDEKGRAKSVLEGALPDVSGQKLTPIECPKGSCVVFGGETIHSSSDNLSEFARHAFVFHVVDDQCVWSEDNWFGKHLARLRI